jgi:TolB protein
MTWPAGGAATFPGENGKIAYIDESHGALPLKVVNADGSARRAVHVPAGVNDGDAYPSFSATGQRIAFAQQTTFPVRREHVDVVNADGSDVTQLTRGKGLDRHPAFSPAGDEIVFDRVTRGSPKVFRIGSDGSGLRRLTEGSYPSLSPDGKRLLFTRGRGSRGRAKIFIAHADGSNAKELTTGAEPRLSPDGRRVVFVDGPNLANRKLYVIGTDGTGRRAVDAATGHFSSPAFSPDGRDIAYSRWLRGTEYVLVRSLETDQVSRVAIGEWPDWGVAPTG